MASLRLPSLRHLATCPLRSTRATGAASSQRRWAQVHDLRFLTNQPPWSVLEKYREKLHQKAQDEGHKSIDDLKAAYAGKIDAHRKDGAIEFGSVPQAPNTPLIQPNRGPLPESALAAEPEPVSPEFAQSSSPSSSSSSTPPAGAAKKTPGGQPAIKTLDDILNLDKVRDLPEKELTALWRLRHASNPQALCAVVPAATYRAMEATARTAPQFVLPVPHPEQGAEMHFLQWQFDAASRTATVLFTQLAEYKARGEFSQPHTTITHHLDLADEKQGLVFMQGHVMEDRGVQPDQARWLVMCLQKFYGGWEATEGGGELDGQRKERAAERRQLLDWFAAGDSRFSVEKLLDEAERMG